MGRTAREGKGVMRKEAGHLFLDWLSGNLRARGGASADASRGDQEVRERLWGINTCEACGRTLLLGEETNRFCRDERVVEVCSLCEARIVAQGFARAA